MPPCLPACCSEVQRILMELLTQMDGFEQNTNVKVRVLSCWARGGASAWHDPLAPASSTAAVCCPCNGCARHSAPARANR